MNQDEVQTFRKLFDKFAAPLVKRIEALEQAAQPTIDSVPSCGQENDYRRAQPKTSVGTIEMKTPQGRKSRISVSLGPNGTVNIVVSRTSEGEALIMLPASAAKTLGELLTLAVDSRFPQVMETDNG